MKLYIAVPALIVFIAWFSKIIIDSKKERPKLSGHLLGHNIADILVDIIVYIVISLFLILFGCIWLPAKIDVLLGTNPLWKLFYDSGIMVAILLVVTGLAINWLYVVFSNGVAKVAATILHRTKSPTMDFSNNDRISFMILSCLFLIFVVFLANPSDILGAANIGFRLIAIIIGKFLWFDSTLKELPAFIKNTFLGVPKVAFVLMGMLVSLAFTLSECLQHYVFIMVAVGVIISVTAVVLYQKSKHRSKGQ